ncbi:uncharacterized protein LOC106154770 [Lingula anatina]|uniref:Uncharacterized protein LOC106154770 n=1 Tax=Lingula anatina TaxID=7574 RepID=A0A1S3HI74_LINAN|nr:uncharacterized protein LOC106154770 [Lingula anatina]|eukprot:XP_013384694.1 uncharacterized protein LOC106154770 [Lingula anatina]
MPCSWISDTVNGTVHCVACRKNRLAQCCRRSCLCLGIALILAAHFLVLPKTSGYYGDPCFLNQTQMACMRHIVTGVIQVLEGLNETYWLDHGTLIGAVRRGDILPFDGDIDIARLVHNDKKKEKTAAYSFARLLKARRMSGNMLSVTYENCKVDMVRYKLKTITSAGGAKREVLSEWYPESIEQTNIGKLKYLTATFEHNVSDILPLARLKFSGLSAAVPAKYMDYIKVRYPFTWRFTFPYKWKCWLPWNIASVWFG